MNKSSKVQITLYLFEQLMTKGFVSIDIVMAEFGICSRSFRRYLDEINIYLANQFKNQEVVYDYLNKVYKLVNL